MAVLAHPDDESVGVGGTLARYACEGIDVFLLTATRGDSGRFRRFRLGDHQHPGLLALANIREGELRATASALGVREVSILNYHDQQLDRANASEVIAIIARHIRRIPPNVLVAFGPDGAYGHPDHIAISQFTTAATVAAADPAYQCDGIHRSDRDYSFALAGSSARAKWPAQLFCLHPLSHSESFR
jgi:LmbE family N-acetylglucosaminyl deacetylase